MGCGFHPFFTILALLRLLLQLFLQARPFLGLSAILLQLWLVLQLLATFAADPLSFQLEQTSKISVEICAPLGSYAQKRLSSA